jgi:hypothetical protein
MKRSGHPERTREGSRSRMPRRDPS